METLFFTIPPKIEDSNLMCLWYFSSSLVQDHGMDK